MLTACRGSAECQAAKNADTTRAIRISATAAASPAGPATTATAAASIAAAAAASPPAAGGRGRRGVGEPSGDSGIGKESSRAITLRKGQLLL